MQVKIFRTRISTFDILMQTCFLLVLVFAYKIEIELKVHFHPSNFGVFSMHNVFKKKEIFS